MPAPKKFNNKTRVNFNIESSTYEKLQQDIKTNGYLSITDYLTNLITHGSTNNGDFERFKNITKQLLLKEDISTTDMEWLLKICQL